MTEEEKVKRPLTYKIYKGMGGRSGCFQFSLAPAYSGRRKPEGAVFVEAAQTVGPNKYDWDNKITFALGANDIGNVLTGFNMGKFDIYHDPDAGTPQKGTRPKRLAMESGEVQGTFFLRLSEKRGDVFYNVSVPLAPHEARTLVTLLTAALPRIMGWN